MNSSQPQRNPETHAAYKRSVLRQVTLPTLIGLLVLIALVAIVIYAGASGDAQVSRWADISLIWILLPCTLFALLILLFLLALTIGLTRLLSILPAYTYRLQLLIFRIQAGIESGTNKVAAPILKLNSLLASARKLLRRR
jgi:hypothetical protein